MNVISFSIFSQVACLQCSDYRSIEFPSFHNMRNETVLSAVCSDDAPDWPPSDALPTTGDMIPQDFAAHAFFPHHHCNEAAGACIWPSSCFFVPDIPHTFGNSLSAMAQCHAWDGVSSAISWQFRWKCSFLSQSVRLNS